MSKTQSFRKTHVLFPLPAPSSLAYRHELGHCRESSCPHTQGVISYSCRKCHHPLRGPEPREAAKHGKPSKATSIITNPNEIQLLRPPVLAAVTRETFYTDILSNLSMSPPVPLVTMLHLCLNSCQLFCITEFMPVFHPWTRHTRLF